ncbi:MAG TPA: hypothetical protein VJP86_15000 [Vicinamibacterales bacterium]|jgi:hypothetical protein|nr:hypothetical protein [Vicinamibacterales bacterium]
MSDIPVMICPRCRGALEYHVTIDMVKPAIGKVDTAYCRACERMYECVRQTQTFYDSTLWPPLCRICRQPVAFVSLWSGEDHKDQLRYECREHASEQWTLTCGTDRWRRTAS